MIIMNITSAQCQESSFRTTCMSHLPIYITLTNLVQFVVTPLAALISSIKNFFFFKTNGKLTVHFVMQGSCVSALVVVQSHISPTWLSLQGTSGYSSCSTWQKASVLAAPTVKKPVPGISNFSPAPPAERSI